MSQRDPTLIQIRTPDYNIYHRKQNNTYYRNQNSTCRRNLDSIYYNKQIDLIININSSRIEDYKNLKIINYQTRYQRINHQQLPHYLQILLSPRLYRSSKYSRYNRYLFIQLISLKILIEKIQTLDRIIILFIEIEVISNMKYLIINRQLYIRVTYIIIISIRIISANI